MNKQRLIDNNRIIESFQRKKSISFSGESLQLFSTGREAVFALLQHPKFQTISDKNVLLPAMLPEGLYYPFQKCGWTITLYNLDQSGHPLWNEIPVKQPFTIAVLIHLFGQIRDAAKFKSLLQPQTLLLEDFAHCLYLPNYSFHQHPGDLFLLSLTKLIGLPDGALVLINNENIRLNPPKKSSTSKFLYRSFNSLSLLHFTIQHKWPLPFGQQALKYLGTLCYIMAYKILMRHCHRPHAISRISRFLFSHIDLTAIAAKRIQFARLYLEQLDNPNISFSPELPNLPIIGFPVFCKHRARLIEHLEKSGIHPTVFSEGWNFIPLHQKELFQSSLHLLDNHLLLPLHQKLNRKDIETIIHSINSFKP